jgi:3-methyladenine DNA glycosylase Tag
MTIAGEIPAFHKEYHSYHYGYQVNSDEELLKRLMFEIYQGRLNQLPILKKLSR